jgi:hypothetical protein
LACYAPVPTKNLLKIRLFLSKSMPNFNLEKVQIQVTVKLKRVVLIRAVLFTHSVVNNEILLCFCRDNNTRSNFGYRFKLLKNLMQDFIRKLEICAQMLPPSLYNQDQ